MPIIVLIRIADPKVLRGIIRETGSEGMHSVPVQVRNSELLASMSAQNFDLVLYQSRLDHCCYELAGFVDVFLAETLFTPVKDPAEVAEGAGAVSKKGPRRSMFIHDVIGPLGI